MNTDLRIGQIVCICEPANGVHGSSPASRITLLVLTLGFGLAVLSQILALAFLPMAGLRLSGGNPSHAAWPALALIAGMIAATFPAALLNDMLGRRVGIALGLSVGIAGAVLIVIAIEQQRFEALVLGAFWLGIAQGFGFYLRHVAAAGVAQHQRALVIGFVIAAGTLGGIAAPYIFSQAERLAAPFSLRGVAIAAAIIQIIGLIVAALGPAPVHFQEEGANASPSAWKPSATCAVALAWFFMVFAMAGVPLTMIGCGFSNSQIVHAVSWHTIAMYAPALLVGHAVMRFGCRPIIVCGMVLCGAMGLALLCDATSVNIPFYLIGMGLGWGLANAAATILLHESGTPSRAILALNDSILFAASALGGWFAGPGIF